MTIEKIIQESFKTQPCPVCNSTDKKVLYRNLIRTCNVLKKSGVNVSNEQVPAEIVKCTKCGHKYTPLVLNDKVLTDYYFVAESEYYDQVKNGSFQVDWLPVDASNRKIVEMVVANTNPGASVLEIGCGMGRLLYSLRDGKFDCYGIEPSGYASKYAITEFGLNVTNGFLDEQTYPDRKFNVIILSDVVEHISDINSLLKLIAFYLTPGGVVVLLTGNSNSLYSVVCGKKWLYYYSWEHISFFNEKSVKYLFNNHSLEFVSFKRTGHSSSVWQNFRIILATAKSMVLNFLGIKRSLFYYMAFDHFIAVGRKAK